MKEVFNVIILLCSIVCIFFITYKIGQWTERFSQYRKKYEKFKKN